MVNASWTARPPIPAVQSRFWQRSPPTLPSQTPSAPPAGFLVFRPISATVLRLSVTESFGGGGSGLGGSSAGPFAVACGRLSVRLCALAPPSSPPSLSSRGGGLGRGGAPCRLASPRHEG